MKKKETKQKRIHKIEKKKKTEKKRLKRERERE